jgi:hypothetical protein
MTQSPPKEPTETKMKSKYILSKDPFIENENGQ